MTALPQPTVSDRRSRRTPVLPIARRILVTLRQFVKKVSGSGDNLANPLAARVEHRQLREIPQVEAEPLEEGGERGRMSPARAVLGLERETDTVRAGAAEETFGPTLGQPARRRAHEEKVGPVRPADEVGPRAHRSCNA